MSKMMKRKIMKKYIVYVQLSNNFLKTIIYVSIHAMYACIYLFKIKQIFQDL